MFDYFINYFNKRFELIKLDVKESTSEIIGMSLFVLCFMIIAVFFVGMLNISIAILLGRCLGNHALGFGVMVLIYLILLLIFYFFRKQIQLFFVNKAVEELNKKKTNE